MEQKQILLGIGTGRCGTVSLATLLNQQEDAAITHESRPLLPWEKDMSILQRKIQGLLRRDATFVGDVAFYYLPYVKDILHLYPSCKIICLSRDKEETVQSYLKKTRGRNHWMQHNGSSWKKDPTWDVCYPKYTTANKQDALRLYWEDYHQKVLTLCREHPENIKLFQMNDALNTAQGQQELLSFLGFQPQAQKLHVGMKRNALVPT